MAAGWGRQIDYTVVRLSGGLFNLRRESPVSRTSRIPCGTTGAVRSAVGGFKSPWGRQIDFTVARLSGGLFNFESDPGYFSLSLSKVAPQRVRGRRLILSDWSKILMTPPFCFHF